MAVSFGLDLRAAPSRPTPSRHVRHHWLMALSAALTLLIGGCAVWVSSYDKEAVDRTTEISKSILKFYQDLLSLDSADRKAAVAGALGPAQGDIETMLRLHLLKEQARRPNEESERIAGNLLESWREFSKSHRSGDSEALSDTALDIERGIMERHLQAALAAEEAKKLGGSSN